MSDIFKNSNNVTSGLCSIASISIALSDTLATLATSAVSDTPDTSDTSDTSDTPDSSDTLDTLVGPVTSFSILGAAASLTTILSTASYTSIGSVTSFSTLGTAASLTAVLSTAKETSKYFKSKLALFLEIVIQYYKLLKFFVSLQSKKQKISTRDSRYIRWIFGYYRSKYLRREFYPNLKVTDFDLSVDTNFFTVNGGGI